VNIGPYVSRLPNDEKLQIIRDYDEWEKTGTTGKTSLRLHTEAIISVSGSDPANFYFYAMALTFTCTRFFSEKYIAMYAGKVPQHVR
jgi:hypothetical protein